MTSCISGRKCGTSSGRIADWPSKLSTFTRASSDLVESRACQRRSDSKFLLPIAGAAELVAALHGDYAILAAGEALVATYETVYFDTRALDLFHAHRRGRRVRQKVRIRHYLDRGVGFLEVKARLANRQIMKTRLDHNYLDDRLSPDEHSFVREQTGLDRRFEPSAWTAFHRVTLIGLAHCERVTLDVDLGLGAVSGASVFPDVAIVEVKQSPYCRGTPALEALRQAGWRPVPVSKYCAAIALGLPNVACNRLFPHLRAWRAAA